MEVNSLNTDLFKSSLDQKKLDPKNNTMGKDQFLSLLIAQLSNQDPTQPMEDKEFIAQMASFSTLEQMTNMSESFEKLASMQEQTQLIQYNEFAGKEVKWDKLDIVNGEETAVSGKGVINTVRYTGGTVEFELADGVKLNPANISELKSDQTKSSLQQASMLIGKKVNWITDQGKEAAGNVTAVSKKNGEFFVITENDDRVGIEELIKITL
ncbi:flagellar hook assembly protein FlgD [Jeotgalibacillus sp. S-D1]|uniref:flagellar hook assembly protein FlgD n=1 Tax=Jeotgalibacillus sp. S-D1 TaxID=2552189 RepID=UPI00105A3D6E|nr:flagellar hook assembly protein FlgD [Jeotgalibacillus sp. S-D1]TDL35039.1 flagellar hook assembly protein FlgD [Jeotgalibacillus sp. S-D1]